MNLIARICAAITTLLHQHAANNRRCEQLELDNMRLRALVEMQAERINDSWATSEGTLYETYHRRRWDARSDN